MKSLLRTITNIQEATTRDAGATGLFLLEVEVDVWDPAPPPTTLTDQAALTALYHSANGPGWHDSDNWLTDAPLSEWHGVETDASGRVTRLDLEANSLLGELPLEFGNLDHLKWVNISLNQLTGELSRSLTNLTMLEYFYFDNNAGLCAPDYDAFQEWAQSLEDFRGDVCAPLPPNAERDTLIILYYATRGDNWRYHTNWLTGVPLGEWHGVTTDGDGRVVELNLNANKLSGHVPPELGNLPDLTYLTLSGNDLLGDIPAELGNLSDLRHLILDHSELTGELPADLGKLINLEVLRLNDNQLTGHIPSELGNLTELEYLEPNHNQLTGGIPVELGNLAKLIWLDLHTNQLGGEIPPELGNLPNLGWMNFTDSGLTGAIPPELGNLPSLKRLSLGGNNLTGEIPPELADIETLLRLHLWENDLTAEAFLPRLSEMTQLIHFSIGGNPRIDGTDVLPHAVALPNLTRLGLHDARLTTEELMPHLSNLSRLRVLALNDNLLTGDRLLALVGEFDDLILLDVGNNQLTGQIPASLGNMTGLRGLFLNGNQLMGEIPVELGNLDFLYELRLNDNRLTGALPQTLTQLEHLNEITFHNNAGLCAPADAAFQEWLQSVDNVQGDICGTVPSDIYTAIPAHCMDSLYGGASTGIWTNECLSLNRIENGLHYARYYTFTLEKPSKIDLTLESRTDPYLILLSHTGEVIAQDDDDDEGIFDLTSRNSGIRIDLEAGDYIVEATTYAGAAAGEFILSFTKAGVAKGPDGWLSGVAVTVEMIEDGHLRGHR